MKRIQFILLMLISSFTIGTASCQATDSSANLNNEQFKTILAAKNAVVLDVRTTKEFSAGHLPSAVHIDVLEEDAFKKAMTSLDRNKTYLVYCRSGKRSATALRIMTEMGFAEVMHLKNGILGWDGPVEQ